MMRAHIDESEQPDQPSVYAVSAVAMSLDACLEFERRWREVLRSRSFGVAVFHAVDLAHFQEEFAGWTEDKRRDFCSQLMPIVRDTIGQGGMLYAAAVSGDVFDSLNKDQRKHIGMIHWPCLQECLIAAARFAASHGDQIQIVIEENKRLISASAAFYDRVQNNVDDPRFSMESLPSDLARRFAGLTILSKKSACATAVALQAADWLAYEVGKELREHLREKKGETRRKVRWPMEQFASMPVNYIEFYESVDEFVGKLPTRLGGKP